MDHWRGAAGRSFDRGGVRDADRRPGGRDAPADRFLRAGVGRRLPARPSATRVVKTGSMWQARQPVYNTSVERWRHYEPWLGELRELLPAAEAEPS